MSTDNKLAYSIKEFEKAAGIGHSQIYLLIASGELKSFSVGRRRFISVDAARRFVAGREMAAN
jgi:hypothetical protein